LPRKSDDEEGLRRSDDPANIGGILSLLAEVFAVPGGLGISTDTIVFRSFWGKSMKHMLFVILLLTGATSAQAETVAATMNKWGLMGAWSVSCDAAAGKGTAAKLRYVAKPDGSVFHYRNFGDDSSGDKIKAARVTPQGWLELKIFFHEIAIRERDRTFAVKKLEPGVVQAIYSYNAYGEHTVKDGKFTSNGNDTPLQHKCD
jgi:hypothetical protein